MTTPNLSKRALLAGAALAGAGIAATTGGIREALAQVLESGIDPKSVLAKVKKGDTLKIGYGQQALWFYKDPKTNELRGVYKELCDQLGRDLEMKVEYQEVVMANSTVALRKGDYDLFGASAVYTVPRALVVNFVGPLWSKGSLAMIHKDNAAKLQDRRRSQQPRRDLLGQCRLERREPSAVAVPEGEIHRDRGSGRDGGGAGAHRPRHRLRHRRQRRDGARQAQ